MNQILKFFGTCINALIKIVKYSSILESRKFCSLNYPIILSNNFIKIFFLGGIIFIIFWQKSWHAMPKNYKKRKKIIITMKLLEIFVSKIYESRVVLLKDA